MEYSDFYKELNDLQRRAVDTIDGPVLVIAGPGTGKTQLLSVRAGAIVEKRRAFPDEILILTYTNAAARSMKERLSKVMGLAGYDVEVGTFHSFANFLIQQSEEAANYVGDKIQMTDIEGVRAIKYILDHAGGVEEIHPFRAPYLYLREILARISDMKRDGIRPADFEKSMKDKSLAGDVDEKQAGRLAGLAVVYKMYEELKEGENPDIFDERGRYDFDDMILFATEALGKERALREKYRERFKYVMIDEYQDTNGAQLEMLFAFLEGNAPNLLCVGDDDQSIYRFQGASVGNFRTLKERFPEIKVVSLKNNYRSTKELIGLSNKVICLIPKKERAQEKALEPVKTYKDKEIEFKEFSTEEEEMIYIINKVREIKKRGLSLSDIAILVRKRKDILKIIDAFQRAGIPYATDGKEDISGERRVKQLLDALQLAHIDPAKPDEGDLSLYKVISSDYFQIPQAEILRFISSVNIKRSKDRSVTLLGEFFDYRSPKMRRAQEAVKNLLSDAAVRPAHSILIEFVTDAGIYKFILKEYADNKVLKIRDLRALSSFINMVKGSDLAEPSLGLDDLLVEMKTRKEHAMPIQGDLVTMTQEGVRVFTAHGSKGLEFHSVIIPFCIQNKNWPAKQLPEKIQIPSSVFRTRESAHDKEHLRQLYSYDETRLFYVAMTRAKSNLTFTASPNEDSVSSFYLTGLGINKPLPKKEEAVLAESLAMTDLKDPFIGTEAVLKDIVKNMTLNPTRLNTYLACRRKFLYNDVLRLPGPKKRGLVFGNCVHKALEEVYTKYKKDGIFPAFEFFKASFEKELKFQGVDKSMEALCLSEERMEKVRRWFERAAKDPVLPLGLEKKLAVTVGDGIIFTGKYDKIEWEDKDKNLVRIVDYKTGKPDDHLKAIDECDDLAGGDCDGYLRQLVAYRLLYEKDKKESEGRRAVCGSLVFIEPVSKEMKRAGYKKGDYVTKTVRISDEMVDALDGIIKAAWDDITNLRFEKFKRRDKEKCGRCDFDDICWE